MKKIVPLILLILFVSACTSNRSGQTKTELIKKLKKTDIAFSDTAQKIGVPQAFLLFADSGVIRLQNRAYPGIGHQGIRDAFKDFPNDIKFTWEPFIADVSPDGELGYTFGEYKIVTKTSAAKDTTVYGNYVSIWKKQPDGNYKYVLDGGNGIPGPLNNVIKK